MRVLGIGIILMVALGMNLAHATPNITPTPPNLLNKASSESKYSVEITKNVKNWELKIYSGTGYKTATDANYHGNGLKKIKFSCNDVYVITLKHSGADVRDQIKIIKNDKMLNSVRLSTQPDWEILNGNC